MEPQELSDFLKWVPQFPNAIIGNGLLYAESKAIFYGRYKSFKSMLALWTAFCIADGRPWLGFDTPNVGAPVLYLQSEIPHPLLQRRVEKMWQHWNTIHGVIRPRTATLQPIYYWTEPYLKLDRSEGIALINRHVANIQPAVLIMDPVYKIMSGNILDPNSVRALLDTVDQVIGNHHISVIMIHHPRKSGLEEDMEWGSDDMLGSVLFSAWADTIVKLVRKGGKGPRDNLTIGFEIVRHAEDLIEPKEVIFDRSTLGFIHADELIQV